MTTQPDTTLPLDKFISDTLVAIRKGCNEADIEIPRIGAPASTYSAGGSIERIDVNFDVAVSITSSSGKSGRGGIHVFGGLIDAGGGAEKNHRHEGISKISFKIPMLIPNAVGERPVDAEVF